MNVVEGLSVTIAQHNPEVDFQTVWASDGEEAKLGYILSGGDNRPGKLLGKILFFDHTAV